MWDAPETVVPASERLKPKADWQSFLHAFQKIGGDVSVTPGPGLALGANYQITDCDPQGRIVVEEQCAHEKRQHALISLSFNLVKLNQKELTSLGRGLFSVTVTPSWLKKRNPECDLEGFCIQTEEHYLKFR